MQKRIKDGQVPGETNPDNAKIMFEKVFLHTLKQTILHLQAQSKVLQLMFHKVLYAR